MKTKKHEDMIEIVGSIIDVFEDFLESKGITFKDIPNKERVEYAEGNLEGLAIIFGSDYDILENDIEEILKNKLK
jgi:hypothetical protein